MERYEYVVKLENFGRGGCAKDRLETPEDGRGVDAAAAVEHDEGNAGACRDVGDVGGNLYGVETTTKAVGECESCNLS